MVVNNKNKIEEKFQENLSSCIPHKHISTLDLISFGYNFNVITTEEGYVLQEVKHCSVPMDMSTFKEQLFHLGIDITEDIYIEAVLHRPTQTKIAVIGFRIGGLERSDHGWLTSGFESYEAKMCSGNMRDMYEEVTKMSEGPTSKLAERYYYNKNKRRISEKRQED